MAASDGKSVLGRIGGWFKKEPAVAVAAFGKCSTANGHQDAAGDPTSGMLDMARALYYEGALPNCSGWESDLRDADRVLARLVVRWTPDRAWICRLASVAEGGTETRAFAPLVACVELESSRALAMMPRAFEALAQVEPALVRSRPTEWAGLLRPVREGLERELERGSASPSRGPGADELNAMSAALGGDARHWIASLAEEIGLSLHPGGARQSVAAKVVGSRGADAPRVVDGAGGCGAGFGVGAAGDVRLWAGVLCAAGMKRGEFWILADDEIRSLHLVAGMARSSDLRGLWSSREEACRLPMPLGHGALVRHEALIDGWAAQYGVVLPPLASTPANEGAEASGGERE